MKPCTGVGVEGAAILISRVGLIVALGDGPGSVRVNVGVAEVSMS